MAEEHGGEETPVVGDVEAEPSDQDDFRMPEDQYEINCSYSWYIPGMLHIVSNITKDMELALAWFHNFLKYLTNICRLLSRKWTRQRFRETCLRSPAAAAFHSMFDGCQRPRPDTPLGLSRASCSSSLATDGAAAAFLVHGCLHSRRAPSRR